MNSKSTTLIIISTIFTALTCRMAANIHAGATDNHGAAWAERDQATGPADKHAGTIRKGEDAVAALKQRGIYECIRGRMESTRNESKKNQTGAEYQAANPAQDMRACFTEQEAGLAAPASADQPTRAALRLSGIGYGEALQPPGEPKLVVSGNRIEYRRATLTEWYINSHDGIEQVFVLETPPGAPTGDGKLTLSLDVRGDLRPQMSSDGHSVLFQDFHGKTVLRCDIVSLKSTTPKVAHYPHAWPCGTLGY